MSSDCQGVICLISDIFRLSGCNMFDSDVFSQGVICLIQMYSDCQGVICLIQMPSDCQGVICLISDAF